MKRINITSYLKAGTFTIENLEETKRVLHFAKELTQIGNLSNRMLLSLSRVMVLDNFDKKKFINAYKKYHFSLTEMKLDNFDNLFISWLQ